MPRGNHKIASDPFHYWIAEVDPQNRIRLPLSGLEVVSWLKPEHGEIEVVGMPGPAGGVQLEPLAVHEHNVRLFSEALADAPPNASEATEAWVEVARLLATAWRIRISVEASRISITLP